MQGALLLGLLTAANAETPGRVAIQWDAPSECPSAQEIEAEIARLVGNRPEVRRSGDLNVHGQIERKGETWSMDLRIETATGARSRALTASTCDELAEIAVVVVAVTVDDSLASNEAEQDTDARAETSASDDPVARDVDPTVARPPATVAPVREAEERPSAPRGQRRTIRRVPLRDTRGAITLAGAFGYGMLPGPTGGFSGAVALLWPAARWELGATGWVPQSQGLAATGASAEIGAWHVDTRGCGVPTVRIVEFPLCAGIQLGAMRGRGRGVEQPSEPRLPWFAFEGSAGVNARVTSFLAVFLVARLTVPVLRPGFEIDEVVVHRAAAAAFSAALGLEVRWRWLSESPPRRKP